MYSLLRCVAAHLLASITMFYDHLVEVVHYRQTQKRTNEHCIGGNNHSRAQIQRFDLKKVMDEKGIDVSDALSSNMLNCLSAQIMETRTDSDMHHHQRSGKVTLKTLCCF